MNRKKITSGWILVCILLSFICNAQDLYKSKTIAAKLLENANAVVRDYTTKVTLESSKQMRVAQKRIVTVLNGKGKDLVNSYLYYDDNKRIIKLEANIYNAFGKQIKKIKKKDFKDVSAVSGGTLYSDSRAKYLEYTPVNYPYTVEFICETIDENTAFIRPFSPLSSYDLSVEKSSYTISYPEGITVRVKAINFEGYNLEKLEGTNTYTFKVENIKAIGRETYSPSWSTIAPKILVAANKFTLEGVDTEVNNWNDLGKWMYNDLIADTQDLPEDTKNEIKALVEGVTDPIEKARKVYQYVQDKVRYISVQVGIGGWKPFNVSKVDELGYGDCKALTNYTMALLNAVGVESHYTIVYARGTQRNIEKDFSAMQGNHAMLNIPLEESEDIWLECTSQQVPFGYIGNFTDDRDVFVVTPQGGQIKHTKQYTTEESLQRINGKYTILSNGGIAAQIKIDSKGIQYNNKYYLEKENKRDLDLHYKKTWKYINDLHIEHMSVENNKRDVVFTENIKFNAFGYAKVLGDRMLLTLNAFNRNRNIPKKYKTRNLPVQVKRGFTDIDVIEIELPAGYKIDAKPKEVSVTNAFGAYQMSIEIKDEKTLVYKRKWVVNKGHYNKEDYTAFRDFYMEVSKNDNTKIALIKNKT